MAVQEQTPYQEITANGVTTSFVLDFDCEDKDHLIVTLDGIEPPVGNWSLTGGSVVFTTAPANGVLVVIQRNTPFSRTTDYQSYNNSFRPGPVNKDFDWIWWKLQELGVADWILGNRIDDLKNYVDDRDDELRAYLLEEIRKQGVALDQLEDYYNYLMQRLAEIAVNGGWESSFVSYGSITQKKYNDGVESIAELLAIQDPFDRMHIYVKSTFSHYVYDTTKSHIDNQITVIKGWILQQNIPGVVDVYQAGFLLNGSDEAAKVQAVLSLNLKLKIPAGTIVYSSTFDQTKIFGEGTFYFLGNVSTAQWSYSPSRALRHDVPTEKPEQKIIETTANWESASALSLLVNQASIDRAQLSGVQSKSQHLGLRFTDTTGIYIGVLAKRHSVFTNCTYTANSVTSNDIVEGLNISAGEFLGVVTDTSTWHLGLIDYVDFPNNKIFVKAWWNTLTKVEETPTVSTCYGPYTNAIWGQNTNVYLQDDRPAHSAIGYELGVRDRRVQGFTSRADGYLAVNLDGTTQKTLGSAFITSGLWRFALNAINIERAAVNMEITASTQSGLRVNQSTASNFVGKIIEATRGDTAEVSYYIDAYGRQSRIAQEYRIISSTTTHSALQFSLVLGANATGAHTTTINTVGMRTGHIIEFRQLQAFDWSIVAGGTTHVLNTSGTLDYLKLLYNGTTFVKILAAKSL